VQRTQASRRLGAVPLPDGSVELRVWAPGVPVSVRIEGVEHPLEPEAEGFAAATVPGRPGDRYVFVVGRRELPDPASRSQPEGVLGPSEIVELREAPPGPALALEELVLYELHVGTFTGQGTFEAAIPRLPGLRELGVTAVELMPIATGPGDRGWGYDGLYISAPHPAYGGPEGLARFVEAAHEAGLGVVLDVVYNHLGPGSEAISAFGPYVSSAHSTLWGGALDYSQRGVREWAIQNAELFVGGYGLDGLRLDAVHAIVDDSPVHVLRELRDRVKASNPDALVISEMGQDDFRPLEEWGHDAMWLDSLHHELHVLLTGERDGYYGSFGSMEGLVRELTRPEPERLVVFAQNHDQIGNRARGDRLPADRHRVALAVVLFSLSTPLLFMGEEYDEPHPFQFFTDHIDPGIAEATREGRRNEFASFGSFGGELPDPQSERTFAASKLEPAEPDLFYRELLELRRTLPRELEVEVDERRLTLRRRPVSLAVDFDRLTAELQR
jgi:maltooligosyltrehalose trehalohydrolase